MITTADAYGRRSFLISSSRTAYPASTGDPLEAPNRSFFSRVVAYNEGSGWLIETSFFKSNGYFQIKRESISRRRWHGRKKIKLLLFFSLTKQQLGNLRTLP